jgi:hypothetical protein
MSSLLYNSCILGMARAQINFETDRFIVMLLSANYIPKRGDSRQSDAQAYEIKGEGYKPGGQRASVAIINDDVGDAIDISLGGCRWMNATINARYAAYYHDNGNPVENELIACVDFDEDVRSTKGTFTLSESLIRIASND